MCSKRVYKKTVDFRWGSVKLTPKEWIPNFININEPVVVATFRNGTIGYYHQSCWDNPMNVEYVQNIETQVGVKHE
jgi:phosphosulfolactate synthase (CoM biosynthesis protein A)